jgi:hypothetical protein
MKCSGIAVVSYIRGSINLRQEHYSEAYPSFSLCYMSRESENTPSYSLYLSFNSKSFRLFAKSLELINTSNHLSIWNCVQKYYSVRADNRSLTINKAAVEKIIFVMKPLLQMDGQTIVVSNL